MTKTQTISRILELTGKAGSEKHFDKVSDWSAKYAAKFLKVIEKLKHGNK